MANNTEPVVKLEAGGKASILSYNVPEPTSYTGQFLIDLRIPEMLFHPLRESPPHPTKPPLDEVRMAMKAGFSDPNVFPNFKITSGIIRLAGKENSGLSVESNLPITPKLAQLDPNEVTSMLEAGKRLKIYRSMYGPLTYTYVAAPKKARCRLYLVETYRLSSYLGNYGAGRTLKTFTLLPGEKTTISIKTYMKRETDAKYASSVLDSFSQDSADDFETSLQNEQMDKEGYTESNEYYAEAELEISWGFGSADGKAGAKDASTATRELLAKNVASALHKHTAKASAKRDIQINTSYEVKQEEKEETSVERVIENINVSRTLNFVFRQMNQEFITIFHLVDVRIGYFNGDVESKREVAVSGLDSLLDDVIPNEPARKEIRDGIVGQLQNILDYNDKPHSLIEEITLKGSGANVIGDNVIPKSKYLRVTKNYMSKYVGATGTEIDVPGIILYADTRVLRTDGVIVEAVLGQGNGLDDYSRGLQTEAVRDKALTNELLQTEIEKNQLGVKIIKDRDVEAAKLFAQVFPTPKVKEKSNEEKSSERGRD